MNVSNLQESKIITRYNPQQTHLAVQQIAPLNFSNSNLRYSNNPPVQNYASSVQSQVPNPINASNSQKVVNYDPNFMGTNWETAQTQNSEVKIGRSCWLGYHRNNYHPSMTQYRISYDEFNEMIDKIEKEAFSFKMIQMLYILIVLLAMFSIILFFVGLFIEPGESVTNKTLFDELDDASTGLIVAGLLIFFIGVGVVALIIVSTLKRYEFNIRKMLQTENQQTYYSRNIHWLSAPHCSYIEIKCLPVSAQQYYLMMMHTNQLKVSKEYLEKMKK